jgi:hypothetical protein
MTQMAHESIDVAVVLAADQSRNGNSQMKPEFANRLAKGLRAALRLSDSEHLVLLPNLEKGKSEGLQHRQQTNKNTRNVENSATHKAH